MEISGTPCVWVRSEAQGEQACQHLDQCDVIAVDVEGESLGHGGRAATIQIAGTVAKQQRCFVVDLAVFTPEKLPGCIRRLLEGKRVACHGFSGDQINLIEQFHIDFSRTPLFDTQVALNKLQALPQTMEQTESLGKGIVDVLTAFGDLPAEIAEEMSETKQKLQFINFFKRPMEPGVVRYICLDVLYLEQAYRRMSELLVRLAGGAVLEEISDGSRYVGPYGRGACYRPPTDQQRQRMEAKGKFWSDEHRRWEHPDGSRA